jgi:hypothetical protein
MVSLFAFLKLITQYPRPTSSLEGGKGIRASVRSTSPLSSETWTHSESGDRRVRYSSRMEEERIYRDVAGGVDEKSLAGHRVKLERPHTVEQERVKGTR